MIERAKNIITLHSKVSKENFFIKKHPLEKNEPLVPYPSKKAALQKMQDDLTQGFKVIVLADLQLADAVGLWKNHMKAGYHYAKEESSTRSRLEAMQEAENHATREIMKKMSGTVREPHFFVVHEMSVKNQSMSFKIRHHGSFYEGRSIPLNLFNGKMIGFVSLKL